MKEAEEKVKLVKDRLKIAQSRQKSYADPKRREVTYEVGDRSYLRVSPLRGVKRFGVKGKLAPRYVGPFKILSRKGEVAMRLNCQKLVKDRLKIAQSRQKSYADPKRREVTYEVGDRSYLRVSPLRGVKRFGVKGKLAPRYVGPFKILSRKGEVAMRLNCQNHCLSFTMCFM